MGAGPSLAKFMRSMEDEELTSMIEDAYRSDPQRIERVFTIAKLRYLENERLKTGGSPGDSEALPSAALSAFAAASASSSASASASAASASLSKEMLSSGMEDHLSHANANASTTANATEETIVNDSKDPINALWSFEGHTLRELQPSEKNPQHHPQHVNSASEGDDAAASARELDEDGHPILYGSCGRDKRYARCSVCYFRGLRCNSAHYCACCQRPVCVRPRKYPGEEHPKICWNVLHTDKDMVHRVEKKKRRRLQAVGMGGGGGSNSSSALVPAAGVAGSMKSDVSGSRSTADARALQQQQDVTPGTTPPADSADKGVLDL